MRLQCLAFALIWIIASPAPGWAQSGPVSDTVLRAAYCVGVLSEAIGFFKELDSERKGPKAFEEKHSRYKQYLMTQMMFGGGEMQPAVFAIVNKGKRDFQRKIDEDVKADIIKCPSSCGDGTNDGPSECTIQCIAKQDQVEANILKCLHQPDQLPF